MGEVEVGYKSDVYSVSESGFISGRATYSRYGSKARKAPWESTLPRLLRRPEYMDKKQAAISISAFLVETMLLEQHNRH